MLSFWAAQSFSALHLGILALPGCEDASLQVPNQIGTNPSRLWLFNALDEAYLDPQNGDQNVVFTGSLMLGRKLTSDIVLKDRAISTSHASLQWRASVIMTPSTVSETRTKKFGRGDQIEIALYLRDTSTNGCYDGSNRLQKDQLHPITMRIVQSPGTMTIFTPSGNVPFDQGPTIALGRSKLSPESEATETAVHPVFAFVPILLVGSPFHERNPRIQLQHLSSLPYPLTDLAHLKILQGRPRSAIITEVRKLVKSEPGVRDSPMTRTHLSLTPGSVYDLDAVSMQPTPVRSSESMDALRARIQTATEEVQMIREERNAQVMVCKRLEEDNERLRSTISRLEADLRRNNTRLQEIEHSSSDSRKTEEQRREAMEHISELEVELGLAKKKAASLTNQLASTQKERDDASDERNRLLEEVERLELKRQQAINQSSTAQTRLEEIEGRLRRQTTEMDRLREEMESLRSAMQGADAERARLQSMIDGAEAQHRVTEQRYNALSEKCGSVEAQMVGLAQENTRLNSQLLNLGQENSRLSAQLETFRSRELTLGQNVQRGVSIVEEVTSRLGILMRSLQGTVAAAQSGGDAMTNRQINEAYTQRFLYAQEEPNQELAHQETQAQQKEDVPLRNSPLTQDQSVAFDRMAAAAILFDDNEEEGTEPRTDDEDDNGGSRKRFSPRSGASSETKRIRRGRPASSSTCSSPATSSNVPRQSEKAARSLVSGIFEPSDCSSGEDNNDVIPGENAIGTQRQNES